MHLRPPLSRNRWYTDKFAGTSSASPIVVGALACVQGMLKAAGHAPLNPAEARTLLRASGSPQQADPAAPVHQCIGSRPDMRALTSLAFALRGAPPP